jgi:endo-1,4-beta-xylanase
MPVNPGTTTSKGTATIDGATYNLYTRPASGASRCASSWTQFYSIRRTARTCGTINVKAHFDAWAAAGMTLGGLYEVKILVEAGGGTGSVNFPVANVTAQ